MSDAAQPGGIRTGGINREWAQVAAAVTDGYVYDAANPTIAARESGKVDETQFAEFDETHAVDSLTVTIAPGEAQVYGWVARDVSTDVDLDASTNGQVVYVGWDFQAVEEDKAIIGTASAFDKTTSDELPKLPLWSFDTDADGVTNADDLRDIDETVHAERTYTDEVRGRNGSTVGLGGETLDDVGGLTNSSGIVGTEELDADISPTWTSEHTFAAGLVVDEGQAIKDGSGNNRVEIDTNATTILDDTAASEVHVQYNNDANRDGIEERIKATDETWNIYDGNFTGVALKYVPSSTVPGILELSNARLDALYGINVENGEGIKFQDSAGNNQFGLNNVGDKLSIADDNNSRLALSIESSGIVKLENNFNLQILEGQAIQDYDGIERFAVSNVVTDVKGPDGDDAFRAVSSNSNDGRRGVSVPSGGYFRLYDVAMSDGAVRYNADSSLGTFQLTRSYLDMASSGAAGRIEWPGQGGGTTPAIYIDTNGEVIARNDDGTTTQLT
jgi:hypothetical protein